MERTLAIIKPDAVAGGHTAEIFGVIDKAGIRIVTAIPALNVKREVWEDFYAEHKGKPFYEKLLDHMSSGRCAFLILEGPNVIKKWRELMGVTDPKKASPFSLRGRFGTEGPANAVHGSDSPESAAREIALFFPEEV